MFGEVVVVSGVAPASVVIPVAAAQFIEGTNRAVVMVADDKGTAVRREVEVGERFDGKVQVKAGLKAGEPVIVQGAYGLAEGTRIRLTEEKRR